MKFFLLGVVLLISLFTACESPAVSDNYVYKQSGLSLDFTFPTSERSRGIYIWVSDDSGNYIDTVQQYGGRTDYANETYVILGHRYANDVCTLWKTAAGEPGTTTSSSELVLDGITTASILPGSSGSYTSESWDLTDSSGAAIADGDYTVNVEVTYDEDGHPVSSTSTASGTISLDGSVVTVDLTLSGDTTRMTAVSASYTP